MSQDMLGHVGPGTCVFYSEKGQVGISGDVLGHVGTGTCRTGEDVLGQGASWDVEIDKC